MTGSISPERAISYAPVNLLRAVRGREKSLLQFLQTLVELESPTEEKSAVDRCLEFIAKAAAERGAVVRRHRNRNAGDILEARFNPSKRANGKPVLVLGHLDTVWSMGTLAQMPFRMEKGRAFGPGVYDMKAGVAMALTALDLLQAENLLNRPVILLLTGDEETGSHASRAVLEKTASRCECVYVLEPAQEPHGAYKTARKGIANYRVHVTGVPAHSGVNYEQGHSAIAELAWQVAAIEALTDLKRGITVNVGTIQGGTRSNVISAEAHANVDVRVPRASDAVRLDRKLKNLRVHDRACVLKVEGALNRPPMERTPGTVALYRRAAALAKGMGFDLREASTGGGSDGNFTSTLGVPTLDGMGAVGEGAHARNESIVLAELAPRTALLAAMICQS